MYQHSLIKASFDVIDREIQAHSWSTQEYPIVRRAIHATADFELCDHFYFSPGSVEAGLKAIQLKTPIVVDVRMVAVAIERYTRAKGIPVYCALDYIDEDPSGLTRTASGMMKIARTLPNAIFVIGNAPTALIAVVELIQQGIIDPTLVIGVPVGFISVQEAKEALAAVLVPQIRVQGRKGGSPVAAAIINALIQMP